MARWTKTEEQYLIDHWQEMTDAEIAEQVGRSAMAVESKRQRLGLMKDASYRVAYTKAENNYIGAHYEEQTDAEMAEHLGRTMWSVQSQRQRLGLESRGAAYRDEEIAVIRRHFGVETDTEIAARLPGRTDKSVRAQRMKLGLIHDADTKPERPPNGWTDEEIQFIREHYIDMDDPELGVALDRSEQAVQAKRCEMDLHRPPMSYAERMFAPYKRRAQQRGMAFGLTRDQFVELIQKPCHYCGSLDTRGDDELLNGLDRVDSDKGYTPDNVVSCCAECNRAKMDRDLDEFRAWVRRVHAHLQETRW